ncbi:MAG: hypothetical protein VW271_02625 [Chloroflexota bacterium]
MRWLSILVVTAGLVLIGFAITQIALRVPSVTGHVVEVESNGLTTFSSLVVRDEDGELWTFEGQGTFTGFTPSHLNEHKFLGETVTIEYSEREDGTLTVTKISD